MEYAAAHDGGRSESIAARLTMPALFSHFRHTIPLLLLFFSSDITVDLGYIVASIVIMLWLYILAA